MLALLSSPLHKLEEAATKRFGDLVADLVTWAKAQYTTLQRASSSATLARRQQLSPHKPKGPPRTAAGLPHPGVAGPQQRMLQLLWPPSQGQLTPLQQDNAFSAHAAAAAATTSASTPSQA